MSNESYEKCLENTDASLEHLIQIHKFCPGSFGTPFLYTFLRDATYACSQGPAPNAYHLAPTIGMPKTTDPRFWQSPAYSLRGKNDFSNLCFEPRTGVQSGPDDTAWPIHDRQEFNVQTPGPAAYLPCYPNLKRGPTPKLLLPLTDGERNIGPSPNAYSLSGEHRSSIKSRRKGYTIKWRTKECGTGSVNAGSPGPAAYSSTNSDVYKYHSPAKTFGIPVRPTDKGTKTPHAYLIVSADGCVERRKPKKFTFGVRHPYKHPPYVVPADNCSPM